MMMVLGINQAFGSWLGYESRALVNGIRAPKIDVSESQCIPYVMRGYAQKLATPKEILTYSYWHFDLWLPASKIEK